MANIFDDSLQPGTLFTQDLRDQGIALVPAVPGASVSLGAKPFAFQHQAPVQPRPTRGVMYLPQEQQKQQRQASPLPLRPTAAAPSTPTAQPVAPQPDVLPSVSSQFSQPTSSRNAFPVLPPETLPSNPPQAREVNLPQGYVESRAANKAILDERDMAAMEHGNWLSEVGKALGSVGKALLTPGAAKIMAAAGMAISPEQTYLGELGMQMAESAAQTQFYKLARNAQSQGLNPSNYNIPGLSVQGKEAILNRLAEEQKTAAAQELAQGNLALNERRTAATEANAVTNRARELRGAAMDQFTMEQKTEEAARDEAYNTARIAATEALATYRGAQTKLADARRTWGPQGGGGGSSKTRTQVILDTIGAGNRATESIDRSITGINNELKRLADESEQLRGTPFLDETGVLQPEDRASITRNTAAIDSLRTELGMWTAQKREILARNKELFNELYGAPKPSDEIVDFSSLSEEEFANLPAGSMVRMQDGTVIRKR